MSDTDQAIFDQVDRDLDLIFLSSIGVSGEYTPLTQQIPAPNAA